VCVFEPDLLCSFKQTRHYIKFSATTSSILLSGDQLSLIKVAGRNVGTTNEGLFETYLLYYFVWKLLIKASIRSPLMNFI
jgi:hypothetical protein